MDLKPALLTLTANGASSCHSFSFSKDGQIYNYDHGIVFFNTIMGLFNNKCSQKGYTLDKHTPSKSVYG